MASQYSSKAGWNSRLRCSAMVGVYAPSPVSVGAVTATREPSRTTRRVLALGLAGALLFGLAACGSDSDSDDAGGGEGGGLPPGDVVLTADNIAWSTDELQAPADTDFTIVIDNQDSGVQHNLDIKETDFKTELEAGVTAREYFGYVMLRPSLGVVPPLFLLSFIKRGLHVFDLYAPRGAEQMPRHALGGRHRDRGHHRHGGPRDRRAVDA